MLIYYPAPATGLLYLEKKMENINFKIDIYYEASKYVTVPNLKKLDVIFNLLNLKSTGIINNKTLIEFSDIIKVPLFLLKDKISSAKTEGEIYQITAKFKMMNRYGMIKPQDLGILTEHSNAKLDYIYRKFDFNQPVVFNTNISDIQLN